MKFFYDSEFLEDGKTIELISIAFVREDGKAYYAVNADMDLERILKEPWLVKNVMPHLPHGNTWKPKSQIAQEVKEFLLTPEATPVELWAWFSSYDHVVLAQLFGKMIDLPEGIPMFTNDLRSLIGWENIRKIPAQASGNHDALEDAKHLKVRYDYVMEMIGK